MTVSKASKNAAATKRPIVPLEGGNSMNAKKGYSSHSPNSPLRGYEGDGDRGTERNYMKLLLRVPGAAADGYESVGALPGEPKLESLSRHSLALCLTLLRPMETASFGCWRIWGTLGRCNGT
jgi:hypothetical protein